VGLVVVGPEAPLAAGIADALREDVPVFGPGADGARLESSKWFAKQVMSQACVPTAAAVVHEDAASALEELRDARYPLVLKADGLAAGKGVCVARDRAAAEEFVHRVMVERALGGAGTRLVREEFLAGEEASLVVVTDGERYRLLPVARDYKRALDGDHGPNTGGMGALAPWPAWSEVLERRTCAEVVEPVLAALRARGIPYRGALYCGLVFTASGPKVLEFNCRLGDPETQATMPLLDESLAAALLGAAEGRLEGERRFAARGAAVSVAVVDEGYPQEVRGDGLIEGVDELERDAGLCVFHAGTAREGNAWRIRGGRALHVVGVDQGVAQARERAYAAVDRLGGRGWRVRRDIARLPAATHP
jgi:phosphoribosylamine--glycine ligase